MPNSIPSKIIIFLVALTSCTSVKYTNIEVLIPSGVVYPTGVQNVVLVNNAAIQPGDRGHENYINAVYKRGEKLIKMDSDTLELDSTGFTCLYNTANHIKEAEFFNDLMVHSVQLDSSSYYYLDQKLSTRKAKELLKEYNADVLISLDQLSYGSKITVNELYQGFYDFATLDVDFLAVWRIYYGDRKHKTQKVIISDTIFWEFEPANGYLRVMPRAQAVSEALWLAGELSGKKLAPHWEEVQRLYYSGGNTYFKLADRYYKQGEWDEASDLWEYIYLTYKHPKKSRAAVNMAYIMELSGDLNKSMEWINKALAAYRASSYYNNEEYKMILKYKRVIQKRLLDENLLIRQFEGG